MQAQTVIDKDYVPKIGDVLSNDIHPCIIIETIYSLDKKSLRVNKNYNDHMFKHELLHGVIQKREIIWEQHKFDLEFFPETNSPNPFADRINVSYRTYCFYHDHKRYQRLYQSKYYSQPDRKVRVVIGQNPMVRVSHVLCIYSNGKNRCYYWGGKNAMALSSLVNQKFVYQGNIYTDIFESHDWD